MRDAFRESALAYRRSALSFVTCAAFRGLVFAVRVAVLHRGEGRWSQPALSSRSEVAGNLPCGHFNRALLQDADAGNAARATLVTSRAAEFSREIGYWIGMNG
jgi:hypothetical protein